MRFVGLGAGWICRKSDRREGRAGGGCHDGGGLARVCRLPGATRDHHPGRFPHRTNPGGSQQDPAGEGRGTKLTGNLFLSGPGTSNVIIRNLTLTNPSKQKKAEGFDGITIRGAKDVFVTKCTFQDCADGSLDITNGADRVTVSWCKFEYSSRKLSHRLVMLIHGSGKKKAKGQAHVTLHHNWFAGNCTSRMPMARKARVHMYNNFVDSKGNDYATNARGRAEIRSERNFYQEIRNPLVEQDGGRIFTSGNIFRDCTGKRNKSDGKAFKPGYPFRVDAAEDVPRLVREGAGA